MGITAKEIAVLAGVSRGTVDRALKNRPGISEETKKKVLAIAEKYDYKPNIIGKALVYSGRPIRIPVLLNSIGNPFFDDVKAGLFAAAEDYAGYGFSLALSEFKGYDPEALLRLLNALLEDTAQLILTPICHPAVEEKLRQLEEKGVRIVMLSSSLNSLSDAVYVGCDYRKSGRVAGRLTGLLTQGHANLFLVTGSARHEGHEQRVEGLCDVLRNEYPGIHVVGLAENDDDDDLAYRVMKNALAEHPETDFVFITAAGVSGILRAIREHSHVVRVCTFDDTPVICEALRSGSVLASICQQPYEQGYQAIRTLFDALILKKEVKGPFYSQLFIKVDQSL